MLLVCEKLLAPILQSGTRLLSLRRSEAAGKRIEGVEMANQGKRGGIGLR